jgi:hypothetical protein
MPGQGSSDTAPAFTVAITTTSIDDDASAADGGPAEAGNATATADDAAGATEGAAAAAGATAAGAGNDDDDDEADPGPPPEKKHDDGLAKESRMRLEHQFLDYAKGYHWVGLAAVLKWDPDLVNAQPCGRWSALHQAACAGEKTVVEWLLYARANPGCKNAEGMQPSDLTTDPEIANLLKDAAEGHFHPEVPPPTPTLAAHSDSGASDDQ